METETTGETESLPSRRAAVREQPRTEGDYRGPMWVQMEVELRQSPQGIELSITGVSGPVPGQGSEPYTTVDGKRRRAASFGQIREHLEHFFPECAPYFEWHLNGMNAGCEHQRAAWDVTEQLEVVTYKLTSEMLREKEQIRKAYEAPGGTLTDEGRAILALPWEVKQAPDSESVASGRYEVDKRETKAAGWVRQDEHPRGLLSKPCEVCGYKYGSAWLFRPLPAHVKQWARTFGQPV
jgi:hypothetical protein